MHALLTKENVAIPNIEEGDAGILLKKDGSFKIFNCHGAIDSENLTQRQIEQGEALIAFTTLLQVPALMNVVTEYLHDLKPKILESGPVH